MKLIYRGLSIFALTATLFADPPAAREEAPAPAQSPAKLNPAATTQIVVDVALFAVPEERALALLEELRDPGKILEAERRLEAMVVKKEAQLLAWPHLTSASGQRAQSESADEFRYATEFDPPTAPVGNEAAEDISGPDEKPKLVGKRPTPTQFETRDLGAKLEIDPLSDDGERIVLGVTFSWVQFRGWDTFQGQIWQPRIASLKSHGTFVLHSGRPRLLGVHRLDSPANCLAILIVRATAEKIGPR